MYSSEWQVDDPAANGIATARSLSRLYAACIGEVDGVRLLKPETLERAMATQAKGEDLVLGYETRYGSGFQLTFPAGPLPARVPSGITGWAVRWPLLTPNGAFRSATS